LSEVQWYSSDEFKSGKKDEIKILLYFKQTAIFLQLVETYPLMYLKL